MTIILNITEILLSSFIGWFISWLQYRDGHRVAKRIRQERIDVITKKIVVACHVASLDKSGALHPMPVPNAHKLLETAKADVRRILEKEV